MAANLRALGIGALLVASLVPSIAPAAWPEKPVRVVIPWAPGGSTDIIGRQLAAELTKRFKQQVIIDNRPARDRSSACTTSRRARPTATP